MSEPTTIPNDWPEAISVPIVSPVAYLRIQAAKLGEMTRGLVRGEVSVTARGSSTILSLDVVVPALDDFRRLILTATHTRTEPYPVQVVADVWDEGDEHEAGSYQAFREIVRKILQSPATVTVVQSLMVRSNDSLQPTG